MAENAAVPKTKGWADFQKKLQPGDVVFHRRGHKYTGEAELNGREFPIRESDVMLAAKGDPYYHPSVYRGKGLVTDAAGWDMGVKNTRLYNQVPEDLRVYRPKATDAQRQKAGKFLNDMTGANYKSEAEVMKHGLGHLAGQSVPTTGDVSKLTPKGVVCSELVAEAYPHLFKDRLMSPIDMRHHPDMDLVARYGHSLQVGAREKIAAHVVHPLLKHAKWGLAAGVGSLALSKLADYRKEERHGSSV
jgi:hypothetical protein